MGIFNGLEYLNPQDKNITIIKFIKPITWIMSHINEYYQTEWTDTVIKINFTPEQITEGYHIDSIINVGHQSTGNVFFRWKLIVDDVISYHGLNTASKNIT